MKTIGKLSLTVFIITLAILYFGHERVFPASAATNHHVYLPLVVKQETKIVLGIYPKTYWIPVDLAGGLQSEFSTVNNWSGKQLSIAGIFHSIEQHDGYIIDDMFRIIWEAGYTPFVNIHFKDISASSIANGGADADIRAWAQQYKVYANGGTRMAFLAPMQEMNGNWESYGSSEPSFFKAAFIRIRQIFSQEGVPAASVKWVFAPNGESAVGWPGFEAYYPGDAWVDVVGFSSYNFGYHPTNQYKKWMTPNELFTPYIDRMQVMAPGKPIFVAQTGTTAYGPNGYNVSLKNQWLEDAYTLLANEGVFGVIYYNANNNFDWAFYRYDDSSIRFDGYREGISNQPYLYIEPIEIMEMIP